MAEHGPSIGGGGSPIARHLIRFGACLAAFVSVIWLLPLSGELSDGTAPPPETHADETAPGSEPEPDETRSATTATTAVADEPEPNPDEPESRTDTPGADGAPAPAPTPDATQPTPDESTPSGPDTRALAAAFVAALVADLNDPNPSSIAVEHEACLTDHLANWAAPDLERFAAVQKLDQLNAGQQSLLVPALDTCFPPVLSIADQLRAGGAPAAVVDCMARQLAPSIGWSVLLILEVDPENEAAQQQMGELAGPAAAACS